MAHAVDADVPIFAITVAAELAEMHPQTLRQYDRLGLVVPGRTQGGSRRYSVTNIRQLKEVAKLSAEGMSLPAIARLMELEREVRRLRLRVGELQQQLDAETQKRPGARVFAAEATGSVIAMRAGTRVIRRKDLVRWRPVIESAPDSDA